MTSPEEEQIVRYAADLARLYQAGRADRQRHQRLQRIGSACLELVRCLSVEAVAIRLTGIARRELGLRTAGVYLVRKKRLLLAHGQPQEAAFPQVAPVTIEDLGALEGQADELESAPWSKLVVVGPVAVIPLVGRDQPLGFLVGEGSLPYLQGPEQLADTSLLDMFAGFGGTALENLLLEERRETARLPGPPVAGVSEVGSFQGIVGQSPAVLELFELIGRLARVDSSVLLTGETGTGKSLVAKALHQAGPRAKARFVALNCAAIPEALVESELFGHEAGAFTGALRTHRGKIEQAEGGTLLLDEIGELPTSVQAKLLTFLEERTYTRVGGEEELTANVRIISTTNRDLLAAVGEKAFRSDLLYRLNVFTVESPPLRSRGADVLALAKVFATEVSERYTLPAPAFSKPIEDRLLGYSWPGNVRELRNMIEKAVILSDGGALSANLFPAVVAAALAPEAGPEDPVAEPVFDEGLPFAEAKVRMIERWEISYLEALLCMTQGNVAKASRIGRIDKKNLRTELSRYGIDLEALRANKS